MLRIFYFNDLHRYAKSVLVPNIRCCIHTPAFQAIGSPNHSIRQLSDLKRKVPASRLKSLDSKRTFLTGSNRDLTTPKLLYLQDPWKYLKAKWDLFRLKLFWDKSFKATDFKLGSTQATILLTDLVRDQNILGIHNLTTRTGYRQISRDMILSRNDPRLQLLKFRFSDIKRAMPIKIHFLRRYGRKHCVIDMFFVGMRNVNDFDPAEISNVWESVRKYDTLDKRPVDNENGSEINSLSNQMGKRRILFAEIFTRFYRAYGQDDPEDWTVDFYKVHTFDVLAY